MVSRRKKGYSIKEIALLKNDEGDWVEDQNELRSMVLEFYKNLFRLDSEERLILEQYDHPSLSNEDRQVLIGEVTEKEVRNALFAMKEAVEGTHLV